ncbi:MAG: protein kinase [Deltaproteobacteria bacterium]|nr:protein kinase [Deltaproteobacteria bacterium]
MADLAPDTVVAGRYRLERLLGEGGMGAVWSATHEITGGRVALKFLKGAGDPRSDARRRFLREARAATLVDHPNVVQIRDVVDFDDTPVLVMDLLQGETLATRLSRLGSLDLGEAARIGLQIIAAVGAAHEAGLIHRDLKPENVFLSRVSGREELVRVLDFGIAKLVGSANSDPTAAVTQSGTLIGTPAYMAPEQVFGEKELDHRVDVWAIGVVLHEMLVGLRPVEGENYGQIAKRMLSGPIVSIAVRKPDLPDDVIDLVDRMLARERDDRLADLHVAVDVLAKYANARRPSFGPPRAPRSTQDSDARPVDDTMPIDANAATENVSSKDRFSRPDERVHSSSASTLVAGEPPRDTADVQISPSSHPPRSRRPGMIAAVVGSLVAVAFVGVGVRSLKTGAQPPASAAQTVAVPSATAQPSMAATTPLSAPLPVEPGVVPSTSVSAVPPSNTAAVGATAQAPAATQSGKIVKSMPVATTKPSATASTTAALVPTGAPSPTPTGGLVEKPPF